MADTDASTVPPHTHSLDDIHWPEPDGEDSHDAPPVHVPPDTDGDDSRSRHPASAMSAQQRSMAAVSGNNGAGHSFRQITGRS